MSDADHEIDPTVHDGLLEHLLDRARELGADAVEAAISESRALDVTVRNQALEDVERSESRDLGLRVFVGKQAAGVSSSDFSKDGVEALAERAVAMAKASPEDQYAGLADSDLLAKDWPDLDLYQPGAPDPSQLESLAQAVEQAALDVKGVKQADQAWAGWAAGGVRVATSTGFLGGSRGASRHFGVSAIAERDGAMERDYDADSARHSDDLKDPATIGAEAGRRAVARLGADKIDSGKMPVLFENRVAGALLGAFAGAIAGPAVARGVSFLKDKLGQKVFSDAITIIDDPHIKRGHGSRPFDGEGVAMTRATLVEKGVITQWLLNSASARQLGLTTNGYASRSIGGPPGVSTSNLWIEPGARSRDEMIVDMGEGLFVTEMFGPSLNANTGDWSVGVSGFQISQGQIAGPVSEITVAGNLLDIYARMMPASDLEFRGRKNTPSLLIDSLAVAGR